MRHRVRMLVCLALLAGCTSGDGALQTDASISSADWLELDLASGTVTALGAPDLRALALARWRTSHVLFRRIPAAVAASDSRLLPGGGEAEDATACASDGSAFLAVFELTNAQWAALNGTSGTDRQPLVGVPATLIEAVVASQRLSHGRLALPDPALWVVGCSTGRQALFSWGDGLAESAAGTYAVYHAQSLVVPNTPAEVGSLLPNAWGLYDMHGNVWEMVRRADGGYEARGGAWDAPILQCRTANAVPLDGDLAVPSVGVRLALRP